MDTEIKARWLDALRDENAIQVKGTLKRELPSGKFGYCCLGVLCELAVEDGVISPSVDPIYTSLYTDEERAAIESEGRTGERDYVYVYTAQVDGREVTRNEHEVLPPAVREWAGISAGNPSVLVNIDNEPEGEAAYELATLNDDEGFDFAMIADAIEQDGEL